MRRQTAGIITALLLGIGQPALAAPGVPMVQGLHYDPASHCLVLSASGDLMPEITHLADPPRIVVDFSGQVPSAMQVTTWLPALKGVRLAQFQPETGRLVFDLDQPMTLEVIRQRANDGTMQFLFRLAGAVTGDNQLQAIDMRDGALQLTASMPLQPVLTQTGLRATLQLPNLRAETLTKLPLASDLFQHLTAVQVGDAVHLQATLTRPEPLTMTLSESGRVVTLSPRAAWSKVDVATRNGPREAIVTLRGDHRFTYQIEREDNRILVTTSGTYGQPTHRAFGDGLLRSLRVDAGEASGSLVLALDTGKAAAYAVSLSEDGRALTLTLRSDSVRLNVPTTARHGSPMIVLDPGHGGNDPGAVGPGGTHEAAVTLSIIGYLQEELRAMGWRTSLARSDDSEVLLAPRVAVANTQGADLFVSVHCNSLDRNWVRGIETYFRNPHSLGLAQKLHASLVTQLGSPDRGVRYANFYVIHHTTMPAVLCEVGYISNPTEEKQLADAAYQRRIAKAIAEGLRTYWAATPK